jgi:hypothetical protein
MKASLAVAAVRHAIGVRAPVATIVHSDHRLYPANRWAMMTQPEAQRRTDCADQAKPGLPTRAPYPGEPGGT